MVIWLIISALSSYAINITPNFFCPYSTIYYLPMSRSYYAAIDNQAITTHRDTKSIEINDRKLTMYLDKFVKKPPTEISNFKQIDIRVYIQITLNKNEMKFISLDKFGKYQIGCNVYESSPELIKVIEEYCPNLKFTRYEGLKPLR